jgi:hypothetical protein
LTDAWHSGTYPSQIRDSCGESQDISLPSETKHQLSVFDKMPIAHRFLHSVQIVQLQKEGLNKYDEKAAQYCHTNKYRSLLAAL